MRHEGVGKLGFFTNFDFAYVTLLLWALQFLIEIRKFEMVAFDILANADMLLLCSSLSGMVLLNNSFHL